MRPLHLVRLEVDMRQLTAFAVAWAVDDDDGGYAAHLALRRRFGAAGPQPFRVRPVGAGGPHLLGYTDDPDALADAWALPPGDDLLGGVFPVAPACRRMPDIWRSGARYGFEVRVRPLVRYGGRVRAQRASREDAWRRRAGEVDAFIAACEKAGGGPVDREGVYRAWLARRMFGAAELERAEMGMHRRVRTRRSSHGPLGPRSVEGCEAAFQGTLAVTEPEAFSRLLARGVGRHAAFGFGMLLLAPPGRS
jgi:CRISPR system Cascade subunit CasE